MEPKMKLVAVRSWLNKVVREDGILVPHLQLCGELQVKYATCTLLDDALTLWNSYVKIIRVDAAYETTWEELKKMLREEYCSRNDIQKMETKLRNLTVKGTNVVSYNRRFQELALLCLTMVTSGYKKVERYFWGLTDDIQGKVTSSRPTKIQEAIRMRMN
ncbi:reverse transcriptase domain-containing protein [Tanacetum coccineum]